MTLFSAEQVAQHVRSRSCVQARAVVDGLPGDIVALALPLDIMKIAESGLINADWQACRPALSGTGLSGCQNCVPSALSRKGLLGCMSHMPPVLPRSWLSGCVNHSWMRIPSCGLLAAAWPCRVQCYAAKFGIQPYMYQSA